MKRSECPLCEAAATAVLDLSEEGICFRCEVCGEFAIADESTLAIQRYTSALRKGLLRSAAARSGPGRVPFISHID